MTGYVGTAIGHAIELGFTEAGPWLKGLMTFLAGQLDDPNYNVWLAGAYHTPYTSRLKGTCVAAQPFDPYFTDWGSVKNAYVLVAPGNTGNGSANAQILWGQRILDPEGGFPNIVRAGASFMPQFGPTIGGYSTASAWSFMYTNANNPVMNDNPKWALLPRTASPVFRSKCDLNGDGLTSAADVALAISQALNPSQCTTADLNGDSVCNVLDVQILQNAVSGRGCKADMP